MFQQIAMLHGCFLCYQSTVPILSNKETENQRLPNESDLSRVGSPDEEKGSMNTSMKAGAQKVLQVFITNAANVFLLDPSEKEALLEEQVDMCKRVLNIYRYMVMNHPLEQQTW